MTVDARIPSPAPQLDLMGNEQIIELLLRAEQRVVPAVRAATGAICAAADLVAAHLRAGGRMVLVGAGSSGRLAVAEAAELPGTFGLPTDRIVAVLAGARGSLAGTDWDEDDADAAAADLAEVAITAGRRVVAVAASGRTPYTLTAAQRRPRRGGAGHRRRHPSPARHWPRWPRSPSRC